SRRWNPRPSGRGRRSTMQPSPRRGRPRGGGGGRGGDRAGGRGGGAPGKEGANPPRRYRPGHRARDDATDRADQGARHARHADSVPGEVDGGRETAGQGERDLQDAARDGDYQPGDQQDSDHSPEAALDQLSGAAQGLYRSLALQHHGGGGQTEPDPEPDRRGERRERSQHANRDEGPGRRAGQVEDEHDHQQHDPQADQDPDEREDGPYQGGQPRSRDLPGLPHAYPLAQHRPADDRREQAGQDALHHDGEQGIRERGYDQFGDDLASQVLELGRRDVLARGGQVEPTDQVDRDDRNRRGDDARDCHQDRRESERCPGVLPD